MTEPGRAPRERPPRGDDSRKPTPREQRAARALGWFGWSLMVGLVFLLMPFPAKFGIAPAGLLAAGFGIWALVELRGDASITMTFLTVLGIGFGGLAALQAPSMILLYDEIIAFEDCIAIAITESGREACADELEQAQQDRRDELDGALQFLLGVEPTPSPTGSPAPSPSVP